MNSKDTGTFLNSAYPVDGGLSEMLSILQNSDESLGSSFLPSVILLVPQVYLARNKRRVDVCGTVEVDTKEYIEGFRFFSSEGELFYADGRCTINENAVCDLVSLATAEDLNTIPKATTPYIWVHPQHWVVKAWFQQLVPGKVELTKGCRYLNRMGLVIEIVSVSRSRDDNGVTVFKDREDRHYEIGGKLLNETRSMFDLVSQVKHWDIFIEHDWPSDGGIVKRTVKSGVPELFDPTGGDRRELMQMFFQAMSTVNDLADQLGIELGFIMKASHDGL